MTEQNRLWEQIAIGEVWCGHEILEELGRGGMGVVYRARPEKTDRIVALKVMLGGPSAAPDSAGTPLGSQGRRLLREAQATAKLDHPNIVKMYAMGNERGRFYFTMEYIAGTTFEKFIAQDAPLEEKIDILIKIAGALQHAHDRQVLHRDIKPSNILLDEVHEPYLADFGLAKMLDRNTQLTKTGQALGTPFYMSPEQIQASRKITAASDVYSLGVVLYQALTGKLPFSAETAGALYTKIVAEDPVPPRVHNPDLPNVLDAICMKAMEKSPGLRYGSASALAEDLLCFREGQKTRVSPGALRTRRLLRKVARQLFWIVPAAAILSVIAMWFCLPGDRPAPVDVTELLEKAHDAFTAGDYRPALEGLDKILAVRPGHKGSLLLRADVLARQGQWEQMRICWARLNELQLSCEEWTRIGASALSTGYLQDARIYLEKASPKSEEGRKLLAETLLYLGRYRDAKRHYLELPETDPEVAIGLAAIYCNEHRYGEAGRLLKNLGDGLSPYLRSRVLFLQAKLLWEQRVDDLNQWEWLFQQAEYKSRYEQIQSALREIGEHLQRAAEPLKETGGNYPYRRLQSELELYAKAIALEAETSPEKAAPAVKDFRALTCRIPLAIPARVFLHNVVIRCLIRNAHWEEAYRECTRAIDAYPWVSDFYHLRGIATFYASPQSLSYALGDIYQAIEFKPWDFLPLENFFFLVIENLTQQENDLFWQICATYMDKLLMPAEQYVTRDYMEALREEYWASDPEQETRAENVHWQELLDVVVHGDSRGAREMAIAMLASQYGNERLRLEIDQLRGQENSPRLKKDLDRMSCALDREQRIACLYRLKGILLEKSSRIDRTHAVKIHKVEGGEQLCRAILENDAESPMMRLLAARAMISLATFSAHDNLLAIAKGESYPANFLAAVALREKGLCIDVSEVFERSYSRTLQKKDFLGNQSPLYRILFTFYVDPIRYPELMDSLVRDPDEMVALCAAFNWRRRYVDLSPAQKDLVTSHFLQSVKSRDSRVRSAAIWLFWWFDSADFPPEMWGLYQKYWRDYGDILVEALQSEKDSEAVFCALQSVILSKCFSCYIVGPETLQNPAILELEQILTQRLRSPDSGHSARVWIAVALGRLFSREVWTILDDPDCNFFIHVSALTGLMHSATDTSTAKVAGALAQVLSVLEKKAKQSCNTSNERRSKQMALLFLGQSTFSFPNTIAEITTQDLKSADGKIRATALSVLGWMGGRRDIPRLYPFLNDSDVNVQRAAATSLASLVQKYTPDEVDKFQEIISDYPERIRMAAAYGYYRQIQRSVCRSTDLLQFGRLLVNYDLYTEGLRKMAKPDWAKVLERALMLWPNSRCFCESALIAGKFRRLSDAHRQLDLALKYLEREPPLQQEELEKKCLLLRSEIFALENDHDHARNCLEQLVQKYPLDRHAHARLSDFYRNLHRERESREHLWLSYLCDPAATYKILGHATLHGDPEEASRWLTAIQQKFPLNYHFLLEVCPSLSRHPWAESLPK